MRFREAVRKGAAVLDERCPYWFEDINLSLLDQESSHLCVLGQLYGSAFAGIAILLAGDWDPFWGMEHGIYTDDRFVGPEYFEAYAELTDEWVAAINARLLSKLINS